MTQELISVGDRTFSCTGKKNGHQFSKNPKPPIGWEGGLEERALHMIESVLLLNVLIILVYKIERLAAPSEMHILLQVTLGSVKTRHDPCNRTK